MGVSNPTGIKSGWLVGQDKNKMAHPKFKIGSNKNMKLKMKKILPYKKVKQVWDSHGGNRRGEVFNIAIVKIIYSSA